MPDASGHGHHKLPPRWRDAFAALPLEAAPPQAWELLRARLPAKPARPRRRPLWLAAAAAMAVVAVLSPRWPPHAPDREVLATTRAAAAVPAPSSGATRPGRPGDTGATAPRVHGLATLASRSAGNDRQRPPATTDATDGDPGERVAAAAGARHPAGSGRARAESGLEALYAESAQLEALLAAARDDRIASSGAAALTDSLDAELAVIDATLSQPGLDAPRSAGLWRRRVDTLRQLAGIETTRRLLSARGETYDAALVSID